MYDNQPIPEPIERIRSFEKLGVGLFIHWGLYSQLNTGEWIKSTQPKHKQDKYHELLFTFEAKEFNARKLVEQAKEAGMKYICLTTRHHEGFSLYDTRGLNEFDAPHSAARRDLIKEYADACHELGMPMFFYHTTIDWFAESFKTDREAYLGYLRKSVELLCKHYGKVAGFWFDGNWAKPDWDWQEDELYGMIRRYHPDCIIVNNTSIGARGQRGHSEIDVVTFEQGNPSQLDRKGMEKYLACEMCETMNSHWGIAANDYSFKSPAELIQTLASCRQFGANLLLNIGLTSSGRIPDYEAAVLHHVGNWVRLCGESLYEGKPTELTCRGKDFILQAGDDYYYYLHNLPISGNMHLLVGESGAGLKTVQGKLERVMSVNWVDNDEELAFNQDLEHGMLTFNATAHSYGHQYIVRVAKITVEKLKE